MCRLKNFRELRLKNTIANLAKPTDAQAAVMKKLGISLTNSSGNMKSFAEVMDNLRSSFSGLSETEIAAAATTLAGKESLAGLLTIVNASTEDFDSLTKAIKGSEGVAGTMAGKMLDNLNGQITLLKSAIEGILITVGDKLLPYIKKAVSWFQTAAEYINGLSDAQVDNIVKWAGIAAAIGPVIMIFGKMVTMVGTVQKTWGNAIKIFTRFKGILGVITSPAGIVIGVLAAIALAAFLIVKNWDQVRGFLQGVGSWFKNVFEKAGLSVEDFRNKFTSIGNTIGRIAGKISGFCKSIAGLFKKDFAGSIKGGAAEAGSILETLAGGTVAAFDGIVTAVDKGLQAFDALLSFFTGAFAGDWDHAAKAFRDSLKIIFPPDMAAGLTKVFDTALPVIKAAVSGVKAMFGGLVQDVKKIFGGIGAVFKGIGAILKGIFSGDAETALKGFQTAAGGIVDTIGSIIKTKINAVKNFVVGAFSTFLPKSVVDKIAGVFDVVAGAWGIAIGAAQKAVNVIVPVVKAVFGAVQGTVSAAVNTISSVISGAVAVFDGLTAFLSGVFTGNWRQAWEGVKSIFKGIFDTFAAICKAPINAVIGIINGAVSSLNKINVTIPDWVPGMGGKSFGINIPTIPMLYKGTDNWQGGAAVIHDRGGEVVDLPKGTRVYPHDKSVEMAREEGGRNRTGSVQIMIRKLADKIEVRSEEDIDRIAEALAYKLKKVAFNTGTA